MRDKELGLECKRNLPIDVSGVENLAVPARHLGVAALELDVDGCPAEIGAHGEVGDAGHEAERGGQVEEDPVRARLSPAQHQDTQGGDTHERAHSIVPVGAADGLVDHHVPVVDAEGVHRRGVVAPVECRHSA